MYNILILLPIIFIACSQSSKQDSEIFDFYKENMPKLDSIVDYLDSNRRFSNLFGKGLSSTQVNYYLLDQLGIDSIYFNSGGCNMNIRQKQYSFTFTKNEFHNIVLSKNRCAGFISHTGAKYRDLDNGLKTVGLGWDWYYWEK